MKGFIDLGVKNRKGHPESAVTPSKTPSVTYPSMYVDGDQEIPGKVGQVIHAHVKLKKTSHTIRKEKNGTTHSQGFDIMAIKHSGKESTGEELAEDNMDGGKPNVQGMLEQGFHEANEAKASKTDHLKKHQFKKKVK